MTDNCWSLAISDRQRWHHYDCADTSLKNLKSKCDKCNFISNFLVVFRTHCRQESNTSTRRFQQFQCEHCNLDTYSKMLYETHQCIPGMRSDIRWFHCDHCNFNTRYGGYLKTHALRKHTPPDAVQWFCCEQCEYKSIENGNLKRHVMLKHTHRNVLKRHLRFKHSDSYNIPWFDCEHCDFKSKYRSSLKYHILVKHTAPEDNSWFQCEFCDFKTNREIQIEQHAISRHTPSEHIRWYQCEHCDFKTKLINNLNRHVVAKHARRCNSRPNDFHCSRKNQVYFVRKHTAYGHFRWKRCAHCAFKTNKKCYLDEHVKREHPVAENADAFRKMLKGNFKTLVEKHGLTGTT